MALLPGDWTDGHVFTTVNVFKKPSRNDMGFALTVSSLHLPSLHLFSALVKHIVPPIVGHRVKPSVTNEFFNFSSAATF